MTYVRLIPVRASAQPQLVIRAPSLVLGRRPLGALVFTHRLHCISCCETIVENTNNGLMMQLCTSCIQTWAGEGEGDGGSWGGAPVRRYRLHAHTRIVPQLCFPSPSFVKALFPAQPHA